MDDDEEASEPEKKSELYKKLEAMGKKIRKAQKKKGDRGMIIRVPDAPATLSPKKRTAKERNISVQIEQLRKDLREYWEREGIPPITVEEIIAWKNEGRP